MLDLFRGRRNRINLFIRRNRKNSFIRRNRQKKRNIELRNVLYIGVSFTGNYEAAKYVPSIASRSLEDNLFLKMTTGKSYVYIKESIIASSQRWNYSITFVHGFVSGKYGYFITRERI